MSTTPDTIHFRTGQVAAANLINALPGVPSPASLAFFGQLNIASPRRILHLHLHLILNAAAGALTIEVYRLRNGIFTRLGVLSVVPADGNLATAQVDPTGQLAQLVAGDYLFCQPTQKDLVTGGANGITVDVHFEPEEVS